MMTPPKAQALAREDFPDQAAWIDKLLRPLNAFMSTTAAFLGVDSVLQGQVFLHDETFTAESSVANSFPRFFAVPRKARSVKIGFIENLTTGDYFTTAPQVTWTPSNGADGKPQVRIRYITGLTASQKFRITFEVL